MSRRTRMGLALVVGTALLLVATWEVAAGESEGDEAVDWSARAIQTWHKTCQRCHTVPDTRFETDRVFLGQIRETT